MATLLVVGGVITLWVAALIAAHSGFPAQAPVRAPVAACATFDQELRIAWVDSDMPTPFGPAFIDVFATREDLQTFDVGRTPDFREPAIAARVPEPDVANAFVWRTATVASGHYHLWTVVREPPQEVASIQITERSPQVVTIVHPSDRVGPSVAVTRPSNALASAQGSYDLGFTACDPTGTAQVTLDVAPRDGPFERIADELPASLNGRFRWSTDGLSAGTWTIRATITDDCGGYYVGYGRYYVDVIDAPDGGVRDVAEAPTIDARVVSGARCEERWGALVAVPDAGPRAEAGPVASADAGTTLEPDSCTTARGSPITLLATSLLLAFRRARRRSDRGPDRATTPRHRR